MIENVREFLNWGPLGEDGRPLKRRKGETFNVFIKALESLGFNVDYRILNAADYGDATVRRRLFIQARRGADPVWPEASHAGHWRAAREIIDWELKGASIFGRKRPLADRTLSRIEAGLRKFGGEAFIAILRGTGNVRSVDVPTPTITAGGKHLGLCQPCIVKFDDQRQDDHLCATSIEKPIGTITTKAGHALCEPFILPHRHGGYFKDRPRSTDEPLTGITTHNGKALCEPFLCKYYGTGISKPVSEPLDTIRTKECFGLVEPCFRTLKPEELERVGAVGDCVSGDVRLDIRFRMLQPHELAAAMSLDNYQFTGTKEQQVKQIGNAVARRTAEALCLTILNGVGED